MSQNVSLEKWLEENNKMRDENKKDRHELANKVQSMFMDVSDKIDVMIEKMSDIWILKVEVENLKKNNEKQERDITNLKNFMYKIVGAVAVISFVAPFIVTKIV